MSTSSGRCRRNMINNLSEVARDPFGILYFTGQSVLHSFAARDMGLQAFFSISSLIFWSTFGVQNLSQEENSLNPGMVSVSRGNVEILSVKSRKLKENSNTPHTDQDDGGNASLEDYHPIDPVPSSKASVRPGPIQHGTPLMPYIPWSAPPPGHKEDGALP
ncbi:unnamed protein product [Fraxinus pennsylvanica]|uniref:Uncharacterized protein n=1 Tax=Fraxinus pennsylvanica TaxID=56036 RepID=A0AAD1ZTS1_9LAMI|nr:unnamed protein product [Fraxinus pennsylvanica]